MPAHFIKNLFGVAPLDEESLRNIPCPRLEVAAHVTLKNVQAGAIIGTLLVGPICAARNPQTRNREGIQQSATKYGLWGVAIGGLSGPLMTALFVGLVSKPRVYDNCYRLRHHKDQIRVDRGSVVGTAAGAGLSTVLGYGPEIGGLVGMSAGVIGMALYNKVILKINFSGKSNEK